MISVRPSSVGLVLLCAAGWIATPASAGTREDYTQGLELAESARFEQAVELIRETGHIGSLPSGALFVHPVDHAWIVSQAVTGEG